MINRGVARDDSPKNEAVVEKDLPKVELAEGSPGKSLDEKGLRLPQLSVKNADPVAARRFHVAPFSIHGGRKKEYITKIIKERHNLETIGKLEVNPTLHRNFTHLKRYQSIIQLRSGNKAEQP